MIIHVITAQHQQNWDPQFEHVLLMLTEDKVMLDHMLIVRGGDKWWDPWSYFKFSPAVLRGQIDAWLHVGCHGGDKW